MGRRIEMMLPKRAGTTRRTRAIICTRRALRSSRSVTSIWIENRDAFAYPISAMMGRTLPWRATSRRRSTRARTVTTI